jgi:hypothetical protein
VRVVDAPGLRLMQALHRLLPKVASCDRIGASPSSCRRPLTSLPTSCLGVPSYALLPDPTTNTGFSGAVSS